MIVTTSASLLGGGFDSITSIGVVRVQAFIKTDFVLDLRSPFQDGVVYSGANQFDGLCQAQENLQRLLSDRALALGANAIVDVAFAYQSMRVHEDDYLMIAASGTAALMRSR